MVRPHLTKETNHRSFERIIEYIKGHVQAGILNPGDKLLPERELAKTLKVGRASVREGLRILESLGLLQIAPGQGAFVKKPDLSVLTDYLGLMFPLNIGLLDDFTSVRIATECEGVRLASIRALPQDLIAIRETLHRLSQSGKDYNLGGQADQDFHHTVMVASHNEVLLFIYQAIPGQLWKMQNERRTKFYSTPGALDFSVRIHTRIYDAIRKGNSEDAVKRMKEHFYTFQKKFKIDENVFLFEKKLDVG